MRRLVFLTILLGVCSPSSACLSSSEFTCPLCGETFTSTGVIGTTTSVGSTDELRPPLGCTMIEDHLYLTCPGCYYSGPTGEFEPDYIDVQFSATPAEAQALRDMLAERRADVPAVYQLFPLERIALTEACYELRDMDAQDWVTLYLAGAWVSDDVGDTELAAEYRRKALPWLAEVAANGPSDWLGTWIAQFQHAALQRTLGQTDEAMAEFVTLYSNVLFEIAPIRAEAEAVEASFVQARAAYFARLEQYKAQEDQDVRDELKPVVLELKRVAEEEHEAVMASQRTLDPILRRHRALERALAEPPQLPAMEADARQAAIDGDFAVRRMFVRTYGNSSDADSRAAIVAFLDEPIDTTPEEIQRYNEEYHVYHGDEDGGFRDSIFVDEGKSECLYMPSGQGLTPWENRLDDARYDLILDLHASRGLTPRTIFDDGSKAPKWPDEYTAEIAELAASGPPSVLPTDVLFPTPDDDGEGGGYVSRSTEDDAVRYLAQISGPEPVAVLQADLARRPYDYFEWRNIKSNDWYLVADGVIARDEAGAVAVAVTMRKRLADGEVEPVAVAATLFPLAYCKGEQSLAVLTECAADESADIRLVAAICLLRRDEPLGKDVLLDESLRRKRLVELGPGGYGTMFKRTIIELVDESDLPKLRQVAAMSDAIWPMAALAKLDPAGSAAQYEQQAGLTVLLAKVQQHEATDQASGAPATGEAWREASREASEVADAAALHCTAAMGDALLAMAPHHEHLWQMQGVIRGLTTCDERRDEVEAFLLSYADRPIPAPMKYSIIWAFASGDFPALTPTVEEWSQSGQEGVAETARQVLENVAQE